MASWVLLALLWPGVDDRREAIDALRRNDSYQRDLPTDQAEAPSAPPANTVPRARTSGGSGGSEVASGLFWVLIGLAGVGLLVVVIRELTSRPVRSRPVAEEPVLPVVRLSATVLDDAEVLASKGHFGDAIHALLLRTFTALQAQASLPPALTSREVLARIRLQDEARAALGHLVQVVELSFFGNTLPGPDEYARCRASYERVLAARGVQLV